MLVQRVQQVIEEWFQLVPELAWVIENPVGSLEKQEYMGADWHQYRKLVIVHYCAYQHVYHKPTHIWTNIFKWKPRGETGTGKCECKCSAGRWGAKGRWTHKFKIARESSAEIQGQGRKAMKNMVPQKLLQEIWSAWRE